MFLTGERWDVEDAWKTGVRYRLDNDGDDLVDELERAWWSSGGRIKKMQPPHPHRPYSRDQQPMIDAQRGAHAARRACQCARVE